MKAKLKTIVMETVVRLRRFFLGGEEHVFNTVLSAEELKCKIRDSTHGFLDYTEGAKGYVMGDSVHVGWSFGWMSSKTKSGPVFHGIIESAQSGSRLRGCVSAGLFSRAFMAVFVGFITLLSLVFVWTVFIPAAGMLLIWIASQMMGDSEAETNIHGYLADVCGMSLQGESSKPACSMNSPS